MHRELTKYLLLHRRLVVPHIGTFALVPQPAVFNPEEEVIHPPGYILEHTHDDLVPKHELVFLSEESYSDEYLAARQLSAFGKSLEERIHEHPYAWPGLGTLAFHNNEVSFVANVLSLSGLDQMKAQKLAVDDVPEEASALEPEESDPGTINSELHTKKLPHSLILPWIILFILLMVIGAILFFARFQPQATGLRIH